MSKRSAEKQLHGAYGLRYLPVTLLVFLKFVNVFFPQNSKQGTDYQSRQNGKKIWVMAFTLLIGA